jgi:hypothetical protein
MAFAHNAMLRGLNALYLQAPNISSNEVSDFLFFAASWSAWVLHHHTIEESYMFPAFQSVSGVTPGMLQDTIEQHYAFADGLEKLHKYSTTTTPMQYDGNRFCALIDIFAKLLRDHLADEIDTLWAMDSVPANSAESQELMKIYHHCELEAKKQDNNVVPPMVLGLCDKTFEGGNNWPKMPWGSAYIVEYWYGKKHRGAWRFLPCNTWGKPRELLFIRKKEEKYIS